MAPTTSIPYLQRCRPVTAVSGTASAWLLKKNWFAWVQRRLGNLNHGILPARHSSLKIRENSLVMSPLTKSTKESLGIFMIPVSSKWLANGKWKWLSDFPTLHPSWWKNSCTTWHVWNPVNNGINTDKLPIRWCRISAINSISVWLLFGSWARRSRAHATIGKFHGRFFRIFLPWPQRTSHIIVSYDEGPMIDEDEDPEFTACQCGWHKETSEYWHLCTRSSYFTVKWCPNPTFKTFIALFQRARSSPWFDVVQGYMIIAFRL